MNARTWVASLVVSTLLSWTAQPAGAAWHDRHEDLPGPEVDAKLIAACVAVVALGLVIAVKSHHEDPPEPTTVEDVPESNSGGKSPEPEEARVFLGRITAAPRPLPAFAPLITPADGGVSVGFGLTFR